ncbi:MULTISPECIES: hypothetical protein [unclassified Oleiphilus]|jgi:response regulator RpfG family c-di-GMP phosphodiesterase|nr:MULTISPECIES: hypothetical protein [unclassified Oleiphilus]KZY47821.1 hypothetical protein A3732_06350 [Oleiphilus sp. HI0050]KZY75584.1 hypothetical protein A3740_15000 [Oleiphilus sp. HI0068]KZY79592.1 hypothetical protein A3741_06625 [Oleiphilus sp. HI0069]KZY87010.1 hypothetical protein A3743_15585 [Oleiphilus sp. HI0072]KZZ25997.1 hypothetical protein A3752_04785 [Oleiphilus sp. HI0081]
MTWNSTRLQLDKAFLFVSDDSLACSSARRVAKFKGLRIQSANSIQSAISFLEHKPADYFLVVMDEESASFSAYSFLNEADQRWPHIKVVSTSSFIDSGELLSKTPKNLELDAVLSCLLSKACEELLSENSCIQQVIDDRLAVLKKGIEKAQLSKQHREQLVLFPAEYLAVCERGWLHSKRYMDEVCIRDSEQFKRFLSQRIIAAVKRVYAREVETAMNSNFRLSKLLRQFGIKSEKRFDRNIESNEAAMVLMLATLKDYYSILGYDIKDMVQPQRECIHFDLGGRFTYNDYFNPLLSSVERGAELACLKLEFFMLAKASNLRAEISYDETYSLCLVC